MLVGFVFREKPDVVFLQEVVTKNLAVLREKCNGYKCILGRYASGEQPLDGEYFVVVMLRNDTVTYVKHEITPFFASKMSRTLLQVQVPLLILMLLLFLQCIFHIWCGLLCIKERWHDFRQKLSKCAMSYILD